MGPADTSAMTMEKIKVRLYNAGEGLDSLKLADLSKFAQDGTTHILGQEFGDRQRLVGMFLQKFPDWAALWEPATNPGRKTVILYKKSAGRLAWWHALITLVAGKWLGRKGAGPDKTEAKRLNRARFVLANGVRVKVLNHHGIASAFSTKGEEARNRQAAWLTQVRAFFRAAKKSRVPCIGGGDWNAQRDNSLLVQALAESGVSWVWDSTGPTHTNRTIDLLGHVESPQVVVLASGVDETDGSLRHKDHRSPWVEYGILPKETTHVCPLCGDIHSGVVSGLKNSL